MKLKTFFIISFLICSISISAKQTKTLLLKKQNTTLEEKLKKLELSDTKAIKPKSMSLFYIQEKKNSESTKIINTKEKVTKLEKNLGEVKDNILYFDNNVVFTYEDRPDLEEKINFNDYPKLFKFVVELYNDKLYELCSNKIDELLKKKLFRYERIKLLLIKSDALLKLNKTNDLETVLSILKPLSIKTKYEPYYFYKNGEVLEIKKEYKKAIGNYLINYNLFPDSILADNSLFKIAKILFTNLNNSKTAIKYLNIILKDYINSDYVDNAFFLKAKIFDTSSDLKNFKKAEETYRYLFKNYPKSEFAEKANNRAGLIRKNFL